MEHMNQIKILKNVYREKASMFEMQKKGEGGGTLPLHLLLNFLYSSILKFSNQKKDKGEIEKQLLYNKIHS